MIQDLHNHTYYSFCGVDRPEDIVEAAIASGIEVYGITDHNYGIGFARHNLLLSHTDDAGDSYERTLRRYYDHINLIKEKYADKIEVKRGIEICTIPLHNFTLPAEADISGFDYCLIENVDHPDSITGGDLFTYAKKMGCPCGVAHTDLFGHAKNIGIDPLDYFSRMAEENIFWEMNVNYDSTHGYREHGYVLEFFKNEEQQDIIRRSGVRLSVGFDGHNIRDYAPDRVRSSCEKITNMGIELAFEQ